MKHPALNFNFNLNLNLNSVLPLLPFLPNQGVRPRTVKLSAELLGKKKRSRQILKNGLWLKWWPGIYLPNNHPAAEFARKSAGAKPIRAQHRWRDELMRLADAQKRKRYWYGMNILPDLAKLQAEVRKGDGIKVMSGGWPVWIEVHRIDSETVTGVVTQDAPGSGAHVGDLAEVRLWHVCEHVKKLEV